MHDEKQPPQAQMMHKITSFWTSCCIYTAAKLNIADMLAKKSQTAEQLAEATNTHAQSLYRVLRALAGDGIFNENKNGEFSNTSLGETLRDNVPGSMKAMALTQLGDHFGAWGNLEYSVKTGGIAFDNVEGMSVWKYYEENPEDGMNFMKAMTGITTGAIKSIVPAYDFTQFKIIVDVGGGNGALLMGVLNSAPEAKGIVYDQEYVVNETNKIIESKGLSDQCSVEAGSFFDSVPPNADAYLMKSVLHDWEDEKCIDILKNCSEAMTQESKLLILESVIPVANIPHPGKFIDINMLVMTGGKERTEKEFAMLLQQAGLKLTQIIHTTSPMISIVEAVKVR